MSEILLSKGARWYALPYEHYPDSLPMVKFWDNLRVPMSICLRPVTLESFMTGLFYVDALRERGFTDIDLVLPCIPGARQDRLNNEGDYLFTLKSIAKEINLRGFSSVTTYDIHSDVAYLIDRLHVVHVDDIFRHHKDLSYLTGRHQAIIAPDAGSAKRAAKAAKYLEIPLVQAWKTRDTTTGKLTGFGYEQGILSEISYDYVNPHFLIVDDLCDGGGTFLGLAKELGKEISLGSLELYITHGLFTQGTQKLSEVFNKIYTTNSTLAAESAENVEVIKII